MQDYDLVAESYADDFGVEIEDSEVIDAFISQLKRNANVLDLGGGTGKLTDFLIKKGYRTTCYDFSKGMMKKALELFPGIPYILDDMTALSKHFKDKTFDGIIAFYSLFHIPKEEIKDIFININHLLNDNGIFCLAVQLGRGEEWINEPYLGKDNNALFVNFFTKNQIHELLQICHFKIISEAEKEELFQGELGKKGQNLKFFVIAQKMK